MQVFDRYQVMGRDFYCFPTALCVADVTKIDSRKIVFQIYAALSSMQNVCGMGKRMGQCNKTEDSVYAYWLYSIKGLGSKGICSLRDNWAREREYKSKDKEIESFAKAVYTMEAAALENLCSRAWANVMDKENKAERILVSRKEDGILNRKERELQELERRGILFYSMEDSAYPDRLRKIPDPPYGLFVRGRLPDPGRPSVAIIGARMASAYGREQARRFARELAENGIQIVSGMARGIDGIAERAAFDGGGVSFAVLGSGVDVCYPKENLSLYERTMRDGGVISEYLPGTQPSANLFPARNRIIAGLAEVLLVIEARAHSGTLITVDMALEQGKEVFALPGRVSDGLSFGCNRLIKQGAGIAMDPEDLVEYFYGVREKTEKKRRQLETEESYAAEKKPLYQKKDVHPLTEMEKLLYDLLSPLDAQNLDTLVEAAEEKLRHRVEIPEITQGIMQLIVYGLAREEGMGMYCRE